QVFVRKSQRMDPRGKPLRDQDRDELDRALAHYEWALTEYRRQLEVGDPADVQKLHDSVLMPALAECERLAGPTKDKERGLVERLRQCHEESLAANRELASP